MVKLKKIQMLTAVAVLAFTASTSSYAATLTPKDSEASIEFKESTEVIKPVDPEKPGEPGTDPGTGMPGPLSIDHISDLSFGKENTISGLKKTYYTTTQKPYLQVSDLRGTGAGWKVTASMSGFTNNGKETMAGAKINLLNGSALSANTLLTKPGVQQNIELTTDNAEVLVMSAAAGSGLGTWVTRWFPTKGSEDVQLTVPAASALVGESKATIIWTLHDAP